LIGLERNSKLKKSM